jgi:hypothetical protein
MAGMETTKAARRMHSPEPVVRMRARLDELSSRITDLKHRHQNQGDAMAGRLARTLEAEEADIQATLRGDRRHTH